MARGNGPNAIAAFGLYQQVPEETREELAARVEATDLTSYEGIAESARHVLAALLRGHVPVDVCAEAREVLQVQLLAVGAKDRVDNGGQISGGAALLVQMVQQTDVVVNKPKLVGQYTHAEPAEVIDVDSQDILKVERKG